MATLDYLSDNIESFIDSHLFKGAPAYPTQRGKRWYSWLYLASFDSLKRKNQIKVGITNNLNRRESELENMHILWAWSMPTSQLIEKDIKQILHEFIQPRTKEKAEDGYTEIIHNIPLEPLILLVRIIILYAYMKNNFIKHPSAEYIKILSVLGDDRTGYSINPNTISYNDHIYNQYPTNILKKAYYNIYKRLGGDKKLKDLTQDMLETFLKDHDADHPTNIQAQILLTQQDEFKHPRILNLNKIYRDLNIHPDTENIPIRDLTPDIVVNNPIILPNTENQPLNDNPPENSRRNELKKGSRVYLACKIDTDDSHVYRFYLAKIISKRNDTKNQQTTILFDWIHQNGTVYDKLADNKYRKRILKWSKERIDFRDRNESNQSIVDAWGVYHEGDLNPGNDQLEHGVLDFESYYPNEILWWNTQGHKYKVKFVKMQPDGHVLIKYFIQNKKGLKEEVTSSVLLKNVEKYND